MEREHKARRARRWAVLLVGTLAIGFIGTSSTEITIQLFDLAPEPLAVSGIDDCGARIRRLSGALDRAASVAVPYRSGSSAKDIFDQNLLPEWTTAADDEAKCSSTSSGTDAFAALLRLRRVLESHVASVADDVAPARRSLDLRLP